MDGVRGLLTAVTVGVLVLAVPAAGTAAGANQLPAAQRVLSGALGADVAAAGPASGAYVVDLTTESPLYAYKADVGRLPASVEKLYTTSTALERFGPRGTLITRVLGTGYLDAAGTWHGTLFLRGGGDPTFGSNAFDQAIYGTGATVQRLVEDLIRATGIRALEGRVVGDGSYFDTRRGTPASGFAPSIYVEGLLDGLSFNRGWADTTGAAYQSRPTLFAARRFAAALRAAGVRVPAGTTIAAGPTPATARTLAEVRSPDMSTLLQLTNTPSDNFFAEMLLKAIGARFGGAGSTAAGAAVVRSELASAFGIDPRLDDGSGLSYYDSTSPRQVVTLLERMAGDTAFTDSLAVAGETGTLKPVDGSTIARGRCRGKTGTLNAVANTVGYCRARDGHTLAFAFLVNGNSSTDYVHNVIEANVMTALARYDG